MQSSIVSAFTGTYLDFTGVTAHSWVFLQVNRGQSYNMILDQHPYCSWNHIPINQTVLSDKFTVYVKFRLTTKVGCCYISVIQII